MSACCKVSVVIPVYGVEQFVGRCVRSLMEQTLDSVEFIFVDDATCDGSVGEIEKAIANYPSRASQVHILHHEHSILCRKAIQQPACRHRDRLGLIPQGSKGIKVRQLTKDHLHGVLHSGRQPSVRSKNDSVHTHPRPFLCFLHLFGVCIVLFVIDVIIVMYILPHFTQTSRGFVKIISALVTCTKLHRHIFAVSPITFRRTTKRAPLPQGRDALLGQNSALKTQTYTGFQCNTAARCTAGGHIGHGSRRSDTAAARPAKD